MCACVRRCGIVSPGSVCGCSTGICKTTCCGDSGQAPSTAFQTSNHCEYYVYDRDMILLLASGDVTTVAQFSTWQFSSTYLFHYVEICITTMLRSWSLVYSALWIILSTCEGVHCNTDCVYSEICWVQGSGIQQSRDNHERNIFQSLSSVEPVSE